MTRLLFVLVLLAVLSAPAAAQPAAPPRVQVRATLDRTALWVGDQATYTIELACGSDTDVLLDDLTKDRLQVTGGEVKAVETDAEETEGRLVRRVRYTFTTFRVDAPQVRIAPLTVRYFARGALGAATHGAPAGQVTVPGTVLAVRSTLPDGGGLPAPREPATLRRAPQYIRLANAAGLVLIAVALVPLVLFSVNLAGPGRRLWTFGRTRWKRRSRRRGVPDLRTLDATTAADRVAAYEQLDQAVREHIELTARVPAQALTPAELRGVLEQRGDPDSAERVEALLRQCERARYSPEPPSTDEWTEAVEEAGRLTRRRWR